MRFLLKEQPYEKPVASGQLRYFKHEGATGAAESWRYTAAFDNYHFLRVDLDGRKSSGHTYLYNLLLNPAGQPEQLKYRFYTAGWRIAGQLLFENGEILSVHDLNGERTERFFPDTGAFWFPSAVGLGLMASHVGGESVTALTLDSALDAENRPHLTPIQVEAAVTQQNETITIAWNRTWRKLTLGSKGFVQTMTRADGLQAMS